ncbi:HK97-gp10 family putative phage morphogenesis protein [Paenibacillus sp. S-38]|uniref:HK97-gp10 family putative phage morphogenesis protein n=1 Tax=Paenibacillus sp. S-38 TaxID=3416710 RepID=UPI003CED37AE
MAEMKLEGMEELVKRLQEMGRKGAVIERSALQAGAEVIRRAASERAPRSHDSGPHLADNITISKIKSSQGMKYVLVGPQKGDNSVFFYGKFLEWGTSKMAARPFLGPVAAEKQGEVIQQMKQAIKDGLGL